MFWLWPLWFESKTKTKTKKKALSLIHHCRKKKSTLMQISQLFKFSKITWHYLCHISSWVTDCPHTDSTYAVSLCLSSVYFENRALLSTPISWLFKQNPNAAYGTSPIHSHCQHRPFHAADCEPAWALVINSEATSILCLPLFLTPVHKNFMPDHHAQA